MNESIRIDCGICSDLLPLVEDGVACEQSREAVRRHMESCGACREKYGCSLKAEGSASESEGEKDDARIVGGLDAGGDDDKPAAGRAADNDKRNAAVADAADFPGNLRVGLPARWEAVEMGAADGDGALGCADAAD